VDFAERPERVVRLMSPGAVVRWR